MNASITRRNPAGASLSENQHARVDANGRLYMKVSGKAQTTVANAASRLLSRWRLSPFVWRILAGQHGSDLHGVWRPGQVWCLWHEAGLWRADSCLCCMGWSWYRMPLTGPQPVLHAVDRHLGMWRGCQRQQRTIRKQIGGQAMWHGRHWPAAGQLDLSVCVCIHI